MLLYFYLMLFYFQSAITVFQIHVEPMVSVCWLQNQVKNTHAPVKMIGVAKSAEVKTIEIIYQIG